jgi:hypothetical protein
MLAAYALDQRGYTVTLLEEKARAGGRCARVRRTTELQKRQPIRCSLQAVTDLCDELRLSWCRSQRSPARFILRDGKLRKFPTIRGNARNLRHSRRQRIRENWFGRLGTEASWPGSCRIPVDAVRQAFTACSRMNWRRCCLTRSYRSGRPNIGLEPAQKIPAADRKDKTAAWWRPKGNGGTRRQIRERTGAELGSRSGASEGH